MKSIQINRLKVVLVQGRTGKWLTMQLSKDPSTILWCSNKIQPSLETLDKIATLLGGYFYYSGFDLICENIKDKNIRILVGLEVDVQVTNRIKEVDRFLKINQSRGQIKEDYYALN